MNSQFPESPEDRLIDELLREQANGPDPAFLARIEAAVDAGKTRVVKRPPARTFSRLALAASIALAAGGGIWWVQKRAIPTATVAQTEVKSASKDPERNEIVPGGFAKDRAVKSHIDAGSAPKGIMIRRSSAYELPAPVEMPPGDSELGGGHEGTLPPLPSAAGPGKGESGAGSGRAFAPGPSSDYSKMELGASRSRQPRSRGDTPAEQTSGDRYGTFIDQPWKTAEHDPLSTFSIDVDTASYGNVRRMIREGRSISKDAVRIEECINAFSYHYDRPKGDGPFAVGATLAVCPWAPTHQLVRVAIKGREIESNKRPASNLVFLIDVSGSMQSPDKLPLLKQSMATLVGQLDDRDRVAIVVYAGTEGVALPSTRIDAEGRTTVLNALSKLEAGGSTNGGAGIKRAYELAMKEKIEGGVNRVILATDGDFNVGVTGRESLVELVKDRAKGGVFLTVCGFGTGNLNDEMMDAITHDGNGNYFYIDSEREGRKVFLRNLSGTLVTIAKDVKIQVEFNPGKVGGYRLIGYANRVLRNEDFNNDKVDAGDIGAGHTVTAFYELTPPGETSGTDVLKYHAASAKPAATDDWLTVKLRYKHPDGDESRKIEFPLTGDAQALDKTDADFQFATAVALFGMKLRGMDEVRETPWGKVLELAKPGLANDANEDRAEFVELVKKLGDSHPPILSAPAPSHANEPEPVDGPNVRIVRHADGSRSVFVRRMEDKTLVGKTYSAKGVLTMTALYRLDANGNPLGCRISDGMNNELFMVRYGYNERRGKLVQELVFDARVKRINPDTGGEMPLQRVVYLYDEQGNRSAPIVYNLLPGKTFEEVFGIKSTLPDNNLFQEADGHPAKEAEIAPGNQR
ncbi:MAG: VWA domain-containing protein [Luteolibacter sp.]